MNNEFTYGWAGITLICLVLGVAVGYLFARKIRASEFELSSEKIRGEFASEIATARERIRSSESETLRANAEIAGLSNLNNDCRNALDLARDERAQLAERAARVPVLDAQLMELKVKLQESQQEVLRLSKSEVEKAQSLSSEQLRFSEFESSANSDRQRLIANVEQWTEKSNRLQIELDQTREERTQLFERAARVPNLEKLVADVNAQLQQCQTDILRLSTSEADKGRELIGVIARNTELSQDLGQTNKKLQEGQQEIAESNSRRSALESELAAEKEAHSKVRNELLDSRQSLFSSAALISEQQTQIMELRTKLEAEQLQSQEKLKLLIEAKEALSNQFRSLASDILEEKSKRFAEQNQTSLGQLLDPLKLRLQEFQGKVELFYDTEGKQRSALSQQVTQLLDLNKTLSDDAKNLTLALKGSSKSQGNWGELILERVLEASGLRKGEEYDVQEKHTREDGSWAQPDVVIHLPEDRHLIVDAKVSLLAYEEFVSAEDEVTRQAALRRHQDSVRSHIKGLSVRHYQELYGLKSLDFVLMFVPIEPAFMLAVTQDNKLFMDAWTKSVLLVSPSTLLFVVRTVAHLWRQEAQSKNAQEIAKRGGELYDRLSSFVSDLEKVGDRLKQAQESYGEAFAKLTTNKGNVIRQAEMLKQLGVKPTKTIPSGLLELSGAKIEE